MKKWLVLILSVIATFTAILSLTACGKVDFTVKFSVDGVEYASVSTGGSEVIKMPADPQKDGYTFDGWFWDDGVWARPFTANSLLNEPLKSDMTVYAKFSVNHSHNFNKQVTTEPYLKSAATCSAKAVYYYSCECGAASETETFTYGELKDHTFNGTHTCAVCGYYDDTLIKTEILSKNLTVNGNEIKGKVANSQTTFSFINDIEVADGANYAVYSDLACVQPIPSKTISLIDGDNVCYILVTNGNDINLYTVTVRRRPIYTVAFDTSGGTEIKSQQVEEDSLAARPTAPNRTGYDFSGFDYDFESPIVENTTINAKWEAVKYKIIYELNGGVNDAENPTTYTIEDKIELKPATKTGYTLKWSDNGVIEKGSTGDKTFTANYTADVKLSSDGTKVTGLNNAVSDLVILSEYNGVKVTGIGWNAFLGCNSLKSVTIPDSVTSIDYGAFAYCRSLINIIIPNGVVGIGGGAFRNCSALSSITISDSVTSIGDSAFEDCKLLRSITIPDNVTSIGGYAFSGCASLKSINVKTNNKNYKSIDGNLYSKDGKTLIRCAVGKADSLFVVPDSVTIVERGAFSDCSSLTNITIPNSVTNIGDYAFSDCTSLTSVTIPDGVVSIGKDAFSGCSGLQEITIPFVGDKAGKTASDTYQYPFGYIFGTSSYDGGVATEQYYHGSSTSSTTYDRFYIPSSLKKVTVTGEDILYGAFYDCSSLESITIGDSVTNIGDYAFSDCTSLTSVTIPDGVVSIGKDAFSGCSGLQEITIPFVGDKAGKTASDTYQYPFGYIFGERSYDGGVATTQVYHGSSTGSTTSTTYYIPSRLKKVTVTGGDILWGAFDYCKSLTNVNILDRVTSIGWEAFYGCTSLMNINISNSVTIIGAFAFSGCSSLTNITIPDSVVSIDETVFRDCTSLKSIYVRVNNKNYKSIDGNLYSKDGKTLIRYAIGKADASFIIPDSVTSIGREAFRGCTSLTRVTIPDGVTSIDGRAFDGCTSLTSVTIPDGVTGIGDGVFDGCTSLRSITIPDSVTSIGVYAFDGCIWFETINYKGTEEQWNSIRKGFCWNVTNGYFTIDINYNYS